MLLSGGECYCLGTVTLSEDSSVWRQCCCLGTVLSGDSVTVWEQCCCLETVLLSGNSVVV